MRTVLHNTQGTADKLYIIELLPEGKLFHVRAMNGRRGGTLTPQPKTKAPVSHAEAMQLFNRIKGEKLSGGYHEISSEAVPVVEVSTVPAPVRPEIPGHMELLPIDSETELNDLLRSKDWVIEPKFDGDRVRIVCASETVNGISRTNKPVALPQAVVADVKRLAAGRSLILDTELIGDQCAVFDVLQHGSEMVHRVNTIARLGYLRGVFAAGRREDGSPLASLTPTMFALDPEENQRFFQALWRTGAEGAVLKKASSPYTPGRGPAARKWKFWNTASVIVTGRHGNKDSVEVELADGRPIGCVTTIGKGMPAPGTVIEVKYLYIHEKGGRLYQPEFLRVREDVEPKDCTEAQLRVKGAPRI